MRCECFGTTYASSPKSFVDGAWASVITDRRSVMSPARTDSVNVSAGANPSPEIEKGTSCNTGLAMLNDAPDGCWACETDTIKIIKTRLARIRDHGILPTRDAFSTAANDLKGCDEVLSIGD